MRRPQRARHRGRLPIPEELAVAPELAILGSVEAALDFVIVALVAAHPELHESDNARTAAMSADAEHADRIIEKAQALAGALVGYRLARRHDRDHGLRSRSSM